MTLRGLCLILLTTLSLSLQAATEVIQLNYVTADDVLPTAQSVLGNAGRANVFGNQLIVNAPPEKIDELRSVIEQIDKQPRRLLISMDTSDGSSQSTSGFTVNGSARAGNVEITAGQGEINGRDQVRIINNSTASRRGGVQQVQATEGFPALIQVGQSVPFTTTGTGVLGQRFSNTEFRNVTQGFLVTATVSGERVTLSIRSNNDRMSNTQPGAINIQSTDTRVSGRLGEWIPLGGVSNDNRSQDSAFLQRSSTGGRDDMSMRIRVDLAP